MYFFLFFLLLRLLARERDTSNKFQWGFAFHSQTIPPYKALHQHLSLGVSKNQCHGIIIYKIVNQEGRVGVGSHANRVEHPKIHTPLPEATLYNLHNKYTLIRRMSNTLTSTSMLVLGHLSIKLWTLVAFCIPNFNKTSLLQWNSISIPNKNNFKLS